MPPRTAHRRPPEMTARWLVPTLVYVLAVGGIGVTSKVALRSLPWQDLILWTGIGYIAVAAILLARGEAVLRLSAAGAWAAASASLAIGGLVAFYIAIGTGEASKVVPISAAYPAVTVALSAVFLAESLTPARCAGVALVIGGVVLVSLAR
jgi:bacterial/archaeal transporter family protein